MPLTRFLGVTGGEVFLHHDLLLRICRYVRDRYQYDLGIATNGFWAEGEARAKQLLAPLVELGLAEMLVSLDDFHLEFVDIERIVCCIRTALELGVRVTIQTIKTRTSHDRAWFQEHLDLPRPPALRWIEIPLHPAGRARTAVAPDEFLYDWTNQVGRCTALRVWNVAPSGEVVPCCGTAFARALRLGNAIEEDLADIVNRGNLSPLVNTLAAWGGPYMLIKTLEVNGNHNFSDRRWASHCHACDTVLRDRKALAILERELPLHQMEAVRARLQAHELWYRSLVLGEQDCDHVPGGWVG
jgi:MoaA/NifB/PqqE/SkfB family radical SAM enzyme